jgi:hypothetical protein
MPPQDVSVSVSSATQNVEDNPDEYHVGISEEQCVKCSCRRKTTLLKPGMSDNNAELNEEKSLMVRDILSLFYMCTHLTFLNISQPCTDVSL